MGIIKIILGIFFLLISLASVVMSDKDFEDNKLYIAIGMISILTAIILIGNF